MMIHDCDMMMMLMELIIVMMLQGSLIVYFEAAPSIDDGDDLC